MNQNDINTAITIANITSIFVILGFFGYLSGLLITAMHCTTYGPTPERTTWMMLVVFVPLGWISYWFIKPKQTGITQLPKINPDFMPPPQTANDIANAIAQDLAREKRERK